MRHQAAARITPAGFSVLKALTSTKNQPKALPKQNEDGDEPHGGRGQDLKPIGQQ
jgi:hypothetical protein